MLRVTASPRKGAQSQRRWRLSPGPRERRLPPTCVRATFALSHRMLRSCSAAARRGGDGARADALHGDGRSLPKRAESQTQLSPSILRSLLCSAAGSSSFFSSVHAAQPPLSCSPDFARCRIALPLIGDAEGSLLGRATSLN